MAVFYARVDNDPVIRPLYGKTLSCAIRGLTDFMTTWLGGPPVYDLPAARLRRRHVPFAIDAQARDAWLANMKAAVREVGIPAEEAALLMAHLEFGARALVNTGKPPKTKHCPVGSDRFDARLAERWNRMAEAETLFDAVSRGDLALMRSLLPMGLVPHAVLMSHALADWLDPTGRADRRFGRRPKQVNPLEVIELLLARRDLDCDPDEGDDLGRFRYLQAMMEAYTGVARMIGPDSPFHAILAAVTHDRFLSEVERDRSCVPLLAGLRGQTLLHDAALVGAAELAAVLLRLRPAPMRGRRRGTRRSTASTGMGSACSSQPAPPLISPAVPPGGRRCTKPRAEATFPGAAGSARPYATIDAQDAKGQTPLRRAVNCRHLCDRRWSFCTGMRDKARQTVGDAALHAARAPR